MVYSNFHNLKMMTAQECMDAIYGCYGVRAPNIAAYKAKKRAEEEERIFDEYEKEKLPHIHLQLKNKEGKTQAIFKWESGEVSTGNCVGDYYNKMAEEDPNIENTQKQTFPKGFLASYHCSVKAEGIIKTLNKNLAQAEKRMNELTMQMNEKGNRLNGIQYLDGFPQKYELKKDEKIFIISKTGNLYPAFFKEQRDGKWIAYITKEKEMSYSTRNLLFPRTTYNIAVFSLQREIFLLNREWVVNFQIACKCRTKIAYIRTRPSWANPEVIKWEDGVPEHTVMRE